MGFNRISTNRYQIAAAVALGSNYTSPPISKESGHSVSFQLNTLSGSTNAGTLKLQGSNDEINYSDLSGASVSVTSGAGTFVIDVANTSMAFVRAVYTAVSGSGNADVFACAPMNYYR